MVGISRPQKFSFRWAFRRRASGSSCSMLDILFPLYVLVGESLLRMPMSSMLIPAIILLSHYRLAWHWLIAKEMTMIEIEVVVVTTSS